MTEKKLETITSKCRFDKKEGCYAFVLACSSHKWCNSRDEYGNPIYARDEYGNPMYASLGIIKKENKKY